MDPIRIPIKLDGLDKAAADYQAFIDKILAAAAKGASPAAVAGNYETAVGAAQSTIEQTRSRATEIEKTLAPRSRGPQRQEVKRLRAEADRMEAALRETLAAPSEAIRAAYAALKESGKFPTAVPPYANPNLKYLRIEGGLNPEPPKPGRQKQPMLESDQRIAAGQALLEKEQAEQIASTSRRTQSSKQVTAAGKKAEASEKELERQKKREADQASKRSAAKSKAQEPVLPVPYEGRDYENVGVAVDRQRREVINQDGSRRSLDQIYAKDLNSILRLPDAEPDQAKQQAADAKQVAANKKSAQASEASARSAEQVAASEQELQQKKTQQAQASKKQSDLIPDPWVLQTTGFDLDESRKRTEAIAERARIPGFIDSGAGSRDIANRYSREFEQLKGAREDVLSRIAVGPSWMEREAGADLKKIDAALERFVNSRTQEIEQAFQRAGLTNLPQIRDGRPWGGGQATVFDEPPFLPDEGPWPWHGTQGPQHRRSDIEAWQQQQVPADRAQVQANKESASAADAATKSAEQVAASEKKLAKEKAEQAKASSEQAKAPSSTFDVETVSGRRAFRAESAAFRKAKADEKAAAEAEKVAKASPETPGIRELTKAKRDMDRLSREAQKAAVAGDPYRAVALQEEGLQKADQARQRAQKLIDMSKFDETRETGGQRTLGDDQKTQAANRQALEKEAAKLDKAVERRIKNASGELKEAYRVVEPPVGKTPTEGLHPEDRKRNIDLARDYPQVAPKVDEFTGILAKQRTVAEQEMTRAQERAASSKPPRAQRVVAEFETGLSRLTSLQQDALIESLNVYDEVNRTAGPDAGRRAIGQIEQELKKADKAVIDRLDNLPEPIRRAYDKIGKTPPAAVREPLGRTPSGEAGEFVDVRGGLVADKRLKAFDVVNLRRERAQALLEKEDARDARELKKQKERELASAKKAADAEKRRADRAEGTEKREAVKKPDTAAGGSGTKPPRRPPGEAPPPEPEDPDERRRRAEREREEQRRLNSAQLLQKLRRDAQRALEDRILGDAGIKPRGIGGEFSDAQRESVKAVRRQVAALTRAADEAELQGSSGVLGKRYQQESARETVGQARRDAAVQELLAASDAYTAALVQETQARARISASLQEQLAQDDQLAQAKARQLAAEAVQQRKLSEQLQKPETGYVDARAGADLEDRRLKAKQEEAYLRKLSEDAARRTPDGKRPDDAISGIEARNAVIQRQLKIEQLKIEALNGTSKLIAEEKVWRERINAAAREEAAKLQSKEDRRSIARGEVADRKNKALIEAEKGRLLYDETGAPTELNKEIIAAEGEGAAARKAQAAAIKAATEQELAKNQEYISSTAEGAKARAEQAARIRIQEDADQQRAIAREQGLIGPVPGIEQRDTKTGELLSSEEAVARATIAQRNIEARKSIAVIRQTNEQDRQLAAEKRLVESQLNAQIRLTERAYAKQALKIGRLPDGTPIESGTRFQNFQARLSPQVRAPLEFPKASQFFAQKAIQTLGYGVAAGALYGSIYQIRELLNEAEELQKVFNQIDAQLQSVGQGSRFGEVREEVLGIARETGVASQEVANVFFQLRGAFTGQGGIDRALVETANAMKLVQVTGLELKEVVDSLTAISRTFNVSMEEIGDTAIDLEERFGVLAKETVTFLGDTAAVADQAGISLNELALIGAVAQRNSGRSGAALAEGINRILPAIKQSSTEILSLYKSLEDSAPDENAATTFARRYQEILGQLGRGETGAALKTLIEDFDSLNEAQQQSIITSLGGRRESQTLIPILSGASELRNEFQKLDEEGSSAGGKLDQRFGKLRDTLQNTGQRLGEVFRQFGVAIFESGVGEFLTKIASLAEIAITAVNALVEAFGLLGNAVDFALGGLPKLAGIDIVPSGLLATAAQYAVLVFALVKGANFLTAALGLNRIAGDAVADSNTRQAAAVGINTTAMGANTTAVTGNTGAKAANAVASNSILNAPTGATRIYAPGGAPVAPTGFRGIYQAQKAAGVGRFGAFKAASAGAFPVSGIGLAAIGLAGATIVYDKWKSYSDRLQTQAGEFAENVVNEDRAVLERIADDRGSFWENLSYSVFNVENPADTAQKELNRQSSDEARSFLQGLVRADENRREELVSQVIDSYAQDRESFDAIFREAYENDPAAFAQDVVKFDIGDYSEAQDAIGQIDYSKVKIDPEKLKQNFQRILEDEGSYLSSQLSTTLQKFIDGEKSLADLIPIINQYVAEGDREAAEILAGGAAQLAQIQIDTVEKRYSTGESTASDLLAVIRENIEILRDKVRTEEDPEVKAGYEEELRDAEKKEQDLLIKDLLGRIERQKNIRDQSGTDPVQSAATYVAELENLLRNPDLTPEQRADVFGKLTDAYQEWLDAEVAALNDPVAAAQRAAEGIDFSPVYRQQAIFEQLEGNPILGGYETDYEKAFGLGPDGQLTGSEQINSYWDNLIDDVAKIVAESDATVSEALLQLIDQEIQGVIRALAAIRAFEESGAEGAVNGQARANYEARLAELYSIRSDVQGRRGEIDALAVDSEGLADSANGVEDEAAELARDKALAALELAQALNEGNAYAEAQIAIQMAQVELDYARQKGDETEILRAQAGLVRAQRQAWEEAVDYQRAQLEYIADAVSDDPVQSAIAEINIAYLELSAARQIGDRAGQVRAAIAINKGQRALADAQNDVQRAYLEWNAGVTQDPVGKAQAEVVIAGFDVMASRTKGAAEQIRAQIAQVQAQQALQDAQDDITRAQFEFIAAGGARDAVLVARNALRLAQFEYRKARGDAEKLRALAGILAAQDQLEDALADVSRARLDVLAAMADAGGDTIQAAEIALRAAREELARLTSQGAGEAEVLRARAEVIRAEAAVRDAQYQDKLGEIDFLLQMEQITTQQAIQMLEALAQLPGLTEEQLRNIRLKIKQLKDELSRDFQYNLPTELGLPTLYSSRRLDQTSGGYQDNRNVTIYMQVNNGMDEKAATEMLTGVLGSPTGVAIISDTSTDVVSSAMDDSRFGIKPRLY